MCGIIGYVGGRKASEVITDALAKLEYRGYDSVGIAVLSKDGKIEIQKDKGMIDEVTSKLNFRSLTGNIAIGHSRWATHGRVCKENAHPHSDCTGKIALAHNGVIENYLSIKKDLLRKGHGFSSETDSEVIAHLIEENAKSCTSKSCTSFSDAFFKSIAQLKGSYAIVAFMAEGGRRALYLARKNSPLIIGVGNNEMFCASDIPAMLKYTKSFIILEEGDLAVLTKGEFEIFDSLEKKVVRPIRTVDWDVSMAQKSGYPHFMLKEIHDQKYSIADSFSSNVEEAQALLEQFERVHIVAAGTSYHASLILAHLLEQKGKTAQTFVASEYAFLASPDDRILLIAITQSGETADVLQAVRHAKKCKKIAITNVVGSSITSLADISIYMNCGPEVGVAATKTFTSELALIYKLVLGKEYASTISTALPKLFDKIMANEEKIKEIARRIANKKDVFFIARGLNVPVAYEGSLKFKEISYIHSEAYPGGELKHGTLSLIEEGVQIIALAPNDRSLQKLFGNIKEVRARGGHVIAFTSDLEVKSESSAFFDIPEVNDPLLYPFLLVIPLQLLAYHVSALRGINPDRPRNLAKSVTVE